MAAIALDPEYFDQLKEIIDETYTDRIDSTTLRGCACAFEEAWVYPDGSIQAFAMDEGRQLAMEIGEDVHIFQTGEDASFQASFAGGKPRNCNKGIACGGSCIEKGKTCSKKASAGQRAKAAEIVAMVHVPRKGSQSAQASNPASKNTMSPKDMKEAIKKRFRVEPGQAIINNKNFRMVSYGVKTSDGKTFSMSNPVHLEDAYRKFVGVLPGEEGEVGYGKVGRYFKPWQTFGLDPNTATRADVKKAYGDLSKKFHPDNQQTGDSEKFQAIHIMYKSILPPEPKVKK